MFNKQLDDKRSMWVILRKSITILLVILLIEGLVGYVDLPLAQYLKNHVSALMWHVFSEITHLGETRYVLWPVLLGYGAAIMGLKHGWKAPAKIAYEPVVRGTLLLMSAWGVGGVIVLALKQTIARARPEVWFTQGFYGCGTAFSGNPFNGFPSSHTSTAFILAAVIAACFPRWKWAAYLLAGLVGVSRLVTLHHYASDVVAAALIGILIVRGLRGYFLDARYSWPTYWPWQWGCKRKNNGS